MAEYSSGTSEETLPYSSGFEEQHILGQGKFESTILYRTDDKVHSEIVLKFICGKDISGSDAEEAITDNIKALIGHVRHPNIVAYLDFKLHEERKQLGIKMEYLSKGSLFDLLSYDISIPWSVLVGIARDVTTGMDYLHTELGDKPVILHENLHLKNILLTKDFVAKVSDYGLKETYALTREFAQGQQAFEDYKFRAPERVQDITEPTTEATDVYGFGIIVYSMLKQSTDPFNPMSEDEVKKALEKGQSVVDPDRLDNDRPDVLVSVLLEATEFKPEQRPKFKDMHRDLNGKLNESHHHDDVEKLQNILREQPVFRPHMPPPEEDDGTPSLKPPSNHSTPLNTSYYSTNSSQSWPSQQPVDEIDGGDIQKQKKDGKRLPNDHTPEESADRSTTERRSEYASSSSTSGESVHFPPERRSEYASSSSTSGESVHFPPRNELADRGEDECFGPQASPPQGSTYSSVNSVHAQSSSHSSVNGVPQQTMNNVEGLTDAMRTLGIQPHPSLNQGIQNGTPSIPNPPNFYSQQSGGSFPGQYPQMMGQQVYQSHSVGLPTYQPNMQSFVNGIPRMANGTGPQIINVTDKSVVTFGDNGQIKVVGKSKKKPLPPTLEEQKVMDSSRPVTSDDLNFVAEHLGKSWRKVGRKLNFTSGQLDAFAADYQGLKETIYQMLRQWKQKEASKATVGWLAEGLDIANKRSIVRKLKA